MEQSGFTLGQVLAAAGVVSGIIGTWYTIIQPIGRVLIKVPLLENQIKALQHEVFDDERGNAELFAGLANIRGRFDLDA